MGLSFDNVTMDEAVSKALELAQSNGTAYIVTPNAEIAYLCGRDENAARAVREADMIVPDGIGIIKAAGILGTPLKERVPGIELGENILPELVRHGLSLYILGGKPGIAALAAKNLSEKYIGLKIAGTADGFFKNDREAADAVNASGADILFVCMGAPRQELWMRDNRAALNVKLMMGLGGSVDGYAGVSRRAPAIFRKTGCEWLYRLIRQPSRFRRMTVIPKYLREVKAYGKNKKNVKS